MKETSTEADMVSDLQTTIPITKVSSTNDWSLRLIILCISGRMTNNPRDPDNMVLYKEKLLSWFHRYTYGLIV